MAQANNDTMIKKMMTTSIPVLSVMFMSKGRAGPQHCAMEVMMKAIIIIMMMMTTTMMMITKTTMMMIFLECKMYHVVLFT